MAFVAAMDTKTTENGALAYHSTQNPFLDIFFQLVRTTTPEQIKQMVEKISRDKSFVYDEKEYYNDDFLNRMVIYTRNVRGGVGERNLAYYMVAYLLEKEDKQSIMAILPHFGQFGYWKDYMNLIKLVNEDTVFNITDYYKKWLTNEILTIYCNQLKEDLDKVQNVEEGKTASISLAAKWMPSDRDAIDKKYHILDKFAYQMVKHLGLEVKGPTYHVRSLLRKNVISPLRKVIKIVESSMCEKDWSNINYEAVPSKAMKRYTSAFKTNDEERFKEYKAGLVKGEKKVNFEAVYPHEIMKEYINFFDSYEPKLNEVAEAQMDGWRTKLAGMGKFGKAVSIVDVSGSMSGEPLEVAISLGALIASVADDPFRNTVITFSERPSFFNLKGDKWCEKANELKKAPWGMNTNFSAIFNLILNRAKECELKKEDMPERLYVFSDMQFDQADSGYHTHYESINRKYQEGGYDLPQLVFWNLRSSSTNPNYPVNLLNTNVALLSGFSPAIIKAVLDVSDLSPMAVMIKAIMDPMYDVIESLH